MADAGASVSDTQAEPDVASPTRRDPWPSTRTRLGFATVGLLIAAFFWEAETSAGQGFRAALVRVGVLAGATWLAWPSFASTRWTPRTRFGRFTLWTFVGLLFLAPKIFLPIAFPLGMLYLLKRPRRRDTPGS